MIYTITTNPAIDMNFTALSSEISKVNRTVDLVYSPNGKGVNVSIVLKHFNVVSKAIGFFGGFTGRYIVDELENLNIETIPIWIKDKTRINIFIDTNENKEYKYVNKGPFVNRDKQEEMLRTIDCLKNNSVLIISGSLPESIDEKYYDEIFHICNKKNIEIILDISSKKLRDLLKYKPLLIKPNDEEIEDIYGVKLKSEKDIVMILKKIGKEGARNILLTLGDKGMYFYNNEKIFYCDTHKIKILSSACAGDSALAAFLSEWLEDRGNIEKAMKKASSVGANVAESKGIGELNNVKEYIKELNIREVL